MWVALFDFCLFLLLVAFFFHGLSAWDRLLTDGGEDDDEAASHPPRRGKTTPAPGAEEHPAGRFWAIWVLVVGCGLAAFSADLLTWFLG